MRAIVRRNLIVDAAIAYQKAHYPKMKLVADRYPGADEIDTAYKTTLDVIKAYPNLKGILGFGSNGPIGAGNAVREKRLGKKIAVVGTVPVVIAEKARTMSAVGLPGSATSARWNSAIPSAFVTGPSAASARASGARRFAWGDSQGKFVSLIAARMSA